MSEHHHQDSIEQILAESLRAAPGAEELPAPIRAALGVRRAQRRRRQLAGASALALAFVAGGAIWTALPGAPGRPLVNRVPTPGGTIARAACDSTLLGLVRCNGGYANLLDAGGDIALSEDWDLGWVGRAPALEPGEM